MSVSSEEYGFGSGDESAMRIANGIMAQADHCVNNGAAITTRIVTAQLALIGHNSAVGQRITKWPGLLLEDAMPLRLAGGLHHLHLTGADARLAEVYSGALTDQAEIDALVCAITTEHDAILLRWLDSPPQTNEAGRSASFMAGLTWLSGRVGPKFELNELGASAGINTMMERYHYNLGGVFKGPEASPMQIKPEWRGPPPPDHPVEIVEIQGCDQHVIDLSDPHQALRVKSYVWPENLERLARMDAAIALAAQNPPRLEEADAADWVKKRLSSLQADGVTRVFHHSIVWQYIPEDRREQITALIEAAGSKATMNKPLAWLQLETNRETFRHELRVRYWNGSHSGADWVLLAEAQAHGAWINWFGSD